MLPCTGRRRSARRSTCCTRREWPRISWGASSWSPSCGARVRGRVRHPLPAGGRPRERRRRRRRGARPLETPKRGLLLPTSSSRSRRRRARSSSSARGFFTRSLRAGRTLARRDSGCRRAVPQRQRLDPAGTAGRARGERSLRTHRIGATCLKHSRSSSPRACSRADTKSCGRCLPKSLRSASASRSTTSGRVTRRSRSCRTSRSTR